MGHNVPGMIVATVHSVQWMFQNRKMEFDEFLDNFAMEKARTKLFSCWLCYVLSY